MTQELVVHQVSSQSVSIFNDNASFEHAQRIAKMLSSSDLVPANYKGNIANTLVALEMANRIGASPLAVMQNMNVIEGRPSWSSTFIIASINTCGRFAPLQFEVTNEGTKEMSYTYWDGPKGQRTRKQGTSKLNNTVCYAWATDKQGKRLEGPSVSIEMAVKEGWYFKDGSKWQSMPELMLRYRAAAFFGRLYAPEVMMGMHTQEEIQDAVVVDDRPKQEAAPINNDLIRIQEEAEKKKRTRKVTQPENVKAPSEPTVLEPEPNAPSTPFDDEVM